MTGNTAPTKKKRGKKKKEKENFPLPQQETNEINQRIAIPGPGNQKPISK